MPAGGEDLARRFYADGLGLTEVEKPADLRARGGAWFRAYDDRGGVTAEIHVGVDDPFAPARKAHPALVVDHLDAIADRLSGLGFDVDRSQRTRSRATAASTRSTPTETGSRCSSPRDTIAPMLLVIFGPPAVGKMTVGRAVADATTSGCSTTT